MFNKSLYTHVSCYRVFLVGYKEFGSLLITDCTSTVNKGEGLGVMEDENQCGGTRGERHEARIVSFLVRSLLE
jgi:hypothetical protein